ncbi:hypothetical protein Tco_0132824 [Tanacetum coccineum]
MVDMGKWLCQDLQPDNNADETSSYAGWAGGDLITLTIMACFYVWRGLQYVAPTIKNIHDLKVTHEQSNLLVKRICKTVIEKVDHDIAWKFLGTAITTAAKYSTHELIEECILTYPGIIWYDVGGFYLFLAAIKERKNESPPHRLNVVTGTALQMQRELQWFKVGVKTSRAAREKLEPSLDELERDRA